MDPWEQEMVAALRQQVKDLKAENEQLKAELKELKKASTVAA
jgi:cell division protein FtsB